MGNFTVLICSICCSVICSVVATKICLSGAIHLLIKYQAEYLEEVKKVIIETVRNYYKKS